jgi:ribose/xylose/arabinose/galactoside ABC-type transport system permease subunit
MNRIKTLPKKIGTHNLALITINVVLIVVMASISPYFLTGANIEVILMGFVLEGIMAIGMTFVIISGGIDLSVSSVLPFAAIITGFMLKAGWPPFVAIIITLISSVLVGFFNASLKNILNVHPFIATLATMLTLRGLALAISSGANLSGFPESFFFLGQGRALGIPFPICVFIILALVMGLLLKKHRYFRQIYFIGYDPQAAKVSGMKVERFFLFVFGLSSGLAGLAGVLAASQYGAAHISFGIGSELRVITAVVIGGTSIVRGGSGTMFGTVLGVLFMAIIYNALVMSGISTYWQDVVNGIMLLAAIFFVEFMKNREKAVN